MKELRGFRPGHSTTTCNLVFNNLVHESLQVRSQVYIVYTDFNKTFDSVNCCVLINILEKSGFDESLLT